ncbi:hypothetical protein RSOL_145900, partial [Rhizoctonia solani AG-3 Rhs1AP]
MTIMQNADEDYGDFHHLWFIQSEELDQNLYLVQQQLSQEHQLRETALRSQLSHRSGLGAAPNPTFGLRTLDDISERGSIAPTATPATVRGDLPPGSDLSSSSGLVVSSGFETLAISDAQRNPTFIGPPRPPTTDVEMHNPGGGSDPQQVTDSSKQPELGGSEGEGGPTHPEGKGKGDSAKVQVGGGGSEGGAGNGKRRFMRYIT